MIKLGMNRLWRHGGCPHATVSHPERSGRPWPRRSMSSRTRSSRRATNFREPVWRRIIARFRLGRCRIARATPPSTLFRRTGVSQCWRACLARKPMANDEVACQELIAASATSGKVLMIAYCMRFHPIVQRLQALLDEGAYGDVFQVSIWTEQLTRYPPDHWASSQERLAAAVV